MESEREVSKVDNKLINESVPTACQVSLLGCFVGCLTLALHLVQSTLAQLEQVVILAQVSELQEHIRSPEPRRPKTNLSGIQRDGSLEERQSECGGEDGVCPEVIEVLEWVVGNH